MQQSTNMPPFFAAYLTKKPLWSRRSQVWERMRKGCADCFVIMDLGIGSAVGGVEAAREACHYLEMGVEICDCNNALGLYALVRG